MKKIIVVVFMFFAFFSTRQLAFAQDNTANPGVTDCGTGGESKACLTAPAGTLKDSQKTKDFVTFMQWALFLGGAVACVMFGLKCASKISDEQWRESLGPGVGSFIAGAMSFIAFKFIA